jgi:AcrR family transcriptional regulator
MARRNEDHRDPDGRDEARDDSARGRRSQTERAILELSGGRGYAKVTIAALLERSRSDRSRFYATWSGKEECFVSAHASAADKLASRLLGACGPGVDWEAGIRAALLELDAFTSEDPAFAAGLISEAHVVGGAAKVKRDEVLARLARALGHGRTMGRERRPPGDPAREMLVLNAIEAIVIRALGRGEGLGADLPAMLFLALVFYRGRGEAARAAAALARKSRPRG